MKIEANIKTKEIQYNIYDKIERTFNKMVNDLNDCYKNEGIKISKSKLSIYLKTKKMILKTNNILLIFLFYLSIG